MPRSYEKREIAGFEFGAYCLYRGRSIVRYELIKFTDAPWPGDAELLKYFGECGLGGEVKHAGAHVLVEVNID